MASGKKHIRMDNIKKAREVWRLKLEGSSIKDMENALLITNDAIEKIIKYPVYEHYTKPTKTPSYYDDKLLFERRLLSEKKKIEQAIASIDQKKKIISIILEATAAIIFVFLVT